MIMMFDFFKNEITAATHDSNEYQSFVINFRCGNDRCKGSKKSTGSPRSPIEFFKAGLKKYYQWTISNYNKSETKYFVCLRNVSEPWCHIQHKCFKVLMVTFVSFLIGYICSTCSHWQFVYQKNFFLGLNLNIYPNIYSISTICSINSYLFASQTVLFQLQFWRVSF